MSNIIEITDFAAPELDVYARLTENQLLNRHEPEKGLFIAESPKVIERALDAGCVPVSLLLERKHITGEAKDILARCKDVPVYTADFEILKQLTGFPMTRGALCAMRRPALLSVEEVCAGARRIAILENVVNPTNVGAIFRSAAALNMDAILLTPFCSNPLYRRAIRVSMGTVFQIPWTYLGQEAGAAAQTSSLTAKMPADQNLSLTETVTTTENLSIPEHMSIRSKKQASENMGWPQPALQLLREMGFKTAAMALDDNSVSIDHPQLMAEEKLAIVLGTEGDGLATSTIADCDYTVKIPMSHNVDSLNVAAASAVAFWQLGNK